MADDYETVKERVAAALHSAAERERALGAEGFVTLPKRIQDQLALLQEQCDPGAGRPTLEVLHGIDHNLVTYRRKLDGAVDIRRQVENESGRRASAQASRRRRRLIGTGVALVVLVVGGAFAKRELAQAAERCAADDGCRRDGTCGARFAFEAGSVRIACAPRSDADCADAESCGQLGRCVARDGACVATPETCEARDACDAQGDCSVVDGDCKPARVEDCRRTDPCTEVGWCTPVDGVCVAGSDADCRQSELCRKHGACLVVEGRCVKPPDDFDKDER